MEFEDQEEHEGDIEMGPSYDSLGNSNSTRPTKMPSPVGIVAAEPQSMRKPRYRECLKNHAVVIGGHAVDGCGEFLAAGAEGSLDALKCAACKCHRNFHRKEPNGGGGGGGGAGADPFYFHQPLLTHYPHGGQFSPPFYRTSSGYLHVAPQQQRPLALPSTSGGGGGRGFGGGSRDEQEDISNMNSGGELKKRFRTKFTADQKEKLLGLAEKLGWRIQKQDEEVVQQFCNELGIRKHVLKVWMHNNKHTLGKKP